METVWKVSRKAAWERRNPANIFFLLLWYFKSEALETSTSVPDTHSLRLLPLETWLAQSDPAIYRILHINCCFAFAIRILRKQTNKQKLNLTVFCYNLFVKVSQDKFT